MRIDCVVNGRPRRADDVWPGESLLYLLRERLGLPGAKNACEQGECGSCTVYLDGVPVCACLVAAGQAQGCAVRTVEGLAGESGGVGPLDRGLRCAAPAGGRSDSGGVGPLDRGLRCAAPAGGPGGGELDAVQAAFLAAGAVQCGFCTPGLVVAVHDLLARNGAPSDPEIREALAGNLCRCTGYEKIIEAVHRAAAVRAAAGPRDSHREAA